MKINNLRIGTQLSIASALSLLFVIIIGAVSINQNNLLVKQTEMLYNHPLQVSAAIGKLESEILQMRLCSRDLLIETNVADRQETLQQMELSLENAKRQFDILNERYLGPKTDVENAYQAFIRWTVARKVNTDLALNGNPEQVIENIRSTDKAGKFREAMSAKIKVIDTFAKNKAVELNTQSIVLKTKLSLQLLLLMIAIVLLTIIVIYSLVNQIIHPINELTDIARRFYDGDLTARSKVNSSNELGVLSQTFNALIENIQTNTKNDEKFANITHLMLSEEDPRTFFRITLMALCNHTNSQMAAVYLLNETKTHYEHYESIGMDNEAKLRFSAKDPEGEFGSVISAKTIQFIKKIPIDTRFVFQTVTGKFIPREIVSIPILNGNELVAIISLAAVRAYTDQSLTLIYNILNTLNARVMGILAFRKMKNLSERLEMQNTELTQQKTEMTAQSVVLTEQNRELEIQKSQLREANRLKTNFLSNMSHELRTPLNSVIALSGVLNRRLAAKISEEEYSYIGVIERNGKHLLSLINDILDISRIESGKEEVEITQFNANELLAEVTNMILPQIDSNNMEILHAESQVYLPITSDRHKCQHILQNLISNAVKFTEKGRVIIKTKIVDNKLVVSIIDSGIGISPDHIAHIFDEFRQADGSTSRKYGGTGLGLAIAKKYANLLGGNITVTSELEKGSTFILTLPLEYSAEKRIVDKPENSHFTKAVEPIIVQPTDGKTILLVEDSEPAIIQMKDFIEESGYTILVAHDGAQALALLENTIPDAMIMDLMMPGVDGFEVLKALRNEDKTANIPVLILSAKHLTKEDLKFLKRNNVHQLIQKGDVNKEDLLTAVVSMLSPNISTELNPQRPIQTINGKPVVLVVEDNMDNMLTVKAIIGDRYTVIEAIDGSEGVVMAKKHKPNLILMDIALPGMDGIEAFKAIRTNARMHHIPIIALTASAMTSDRETILAHGFDGYLVKPIDEKVFFKTIEEVLFGK